MQSEIFKDGNLQRQQCELFQIVLRECCSLNELVICNSNSITSPFVCSYTTFGGRGSFLSFLADDTTKIKISSDIQFLTVSLPWLPDQDAKGLWKLLLNMPLLEEINLPSAEESHSSDSYSYIKIIILLCQYLEDRDMAHYLKVTCLYLY